MTVPSGPDGIASAPLVLQRKFSQESNFSYVSGRLNARFRDFWNATALEELETISLIDFERAVQRSAYGPTYRQDFMLAAQPVVMRLSTLFNAETSRRLGDLLRWSKGRTAIVSALLGLLSDLPLGLDFLRNLAFRHTSLPQKPCFGLLETPFWRALWEASNDDDRIISLCDSQNAPQAELLIRSVEAVRGKNRLAGELVWVDGLFRLALGWLHQTGTEGAALRPLVNQWIDPWNYRIWSLRRRDNAAVDTPFLSVQGELRLEILCSARSERTLLAGTIWSSLRSPEDRNTALDMERAFLSRQAKLNRSDPLGAGLMAAYVARQLLELWRFTETLSRLTMDGESS